jgi:hypothetical protein
MPTSYRIVLTYTDNGGDNGFPESWDWWTLLNIGPYEALSVVEVSEISLPTAHAEEIEQMQDPEYLAALNELEDWA